MDIKDSEFLKRIQATFRIEAEEHLQSFSAGLIELENPESNDHVVALTETMFRNVHSLKGAARSIGQKDIESVCQPLESLFSALKKKEIELNSTMFDLFYKTRDVISKLVLKEGVEQSPTESQIQKEVIQNIKMIILQAQLSGNVNESTKNEEIIPNQFLNNDISGTENTPDLKKSSKLSFAEVVRIPVSKLDPILLRAEEFIQTKISINQQTEELAKIRDEVVEWKAESLKWRGRKFTTSNQWNEWHEQNELYLNKLENNLMKITRSMERDQYILENLVNDQLDSIKQVLMLPVSSLVEVFPAMVREITHELQKEIDFKIIGTDLEIDKRILEELKDPLIHLLRNSIDHGIGSPRERKLLNKPERGNITLVFTAKESGLVEITVSDDGKGIDRDKVLNAAMESNMLTREAADSMDTDDILNLIFLSGISTSSIITDLSGRGLGLSIVREKIEKLNGRLSIETEIKKGTTFRILVPMTLANFRGLLIGLGEFLFVLPTMNVERVLRIKKEDITSVENHETIRIDEDILSLINLSEVLGVAERRNGDYRSQYTDTFQSEYLSIVILVSGGKRMAFKVDEILDEHQVLVKGMGAMLNRVRNIAGATILGSGKIVPVLHIADLMRSSVQSSGKRIESSPEEIDKLKFKRILVAEDSITSRTLLKNILETAGYLVTVAIDGAEAFARTKSDEFDLIVSDVDMPRMNGFELTAKIRGDKKMSEIPVVLVTALESREDRERGLEAGADAYIVKSSFDQGNLLEVIKKLI